MLQMFLFAAIAAPTPLAAEQARRVDCVATLAIIAARQQGDDAAALVYPPLQRDGARFAQVVGEDLIRAGRTKEQARDAFVAAVSARQKAAMAKGGATVAELDAREVAGCIDLMRAVAPPPAPPSLAQCAGILRLAADQARRDAGAVDKDLETFAAVLDSRARDTLRAEGKSGSEIDIVMSTTRSEIAADAARRDADDVAGELDATPCFEMVKP